MKTSERDRAICEQFLRSPYSDKASFFVYDSTASEVDTHVIVAALIQCGRQVVVPRVENGEMKAVPISENTELFYGIRQPRTGEDTPVCVALVPLLAADRQGYRLGYGGGYYDKYFASHPNVLRVGLAYSEQVVSELPHTEHDVRLHAIITEKEIILV